MVDVWLACALSCVDKLYHAGASIRSEPPATADVTHEKSATVSACHNILRMSEHGQLQAGQTEAKPV